MELVRIARGSFATAYLELGGTRVFCVTDHPGHGKEILAHAAERCVSPHLPRVERWGELPPRGPLRAREVWVMPYYRPLICEESPAAWAQLNALRKCATDTDNLLGDDIGALHNYQTLFYARVHLSSEPALLAALEVLVEEAALASEDYVFEFSPRNVAVDDEGHLVLLDVLYDEAQFGKLADRDLYRRVGRKRVRSHAVASPRRLVLPT